MKKLGVKRHLNNERGMASIEATVLAVLFFTMLWYTFGFFGVVHTGIIHNIHARTYAFETFRHRANLYHFRSNRASNQHYYNKNVRIHGINTDSQDLPTTQIATERPITFGMALEEQGRRPDTHNNEVINRVPAGSRNQRVEVNPVWILTMYGLCLNNECGG